MTCSTRIEPFPVYRSLGSTDSAGEPPSSGEVCRAGETAQVGVQVIDVLRLALWVEQLVRKRQADRIVAEGAHLVEQVPPGAVPQAIGSEGARFQSVPIDTAQSHLITACVTDDTAVSMQIWAVRGHGSRQVGRDGTGARGQRHGGRAWRNAYALQRGRSLLQWHGLARPGASCVPLM
jgi:hypothetical protein